MFTVGGINCTLMIHERGGSPCLYRLDLKIYPIETIPNSIPAAAARRVTTRRITLVSRWPLGGTTGSAKMTEGFSCFRTSVLNKARGGKQAMRETGLIVLTKMVNTVSNAETL